MSTLQTPAVSLLATICLTVVGPAVAAENTVFSTDFESGLPAEFSAPGAAIEGVQGWSGLGSGNHSFAGTFLRHSEIGSTSIDLHLTGLPAHDLISIDCLVALIDSWDGEFFEVLVDGEVIYSEWFDLASSRTYSYKPPAGAQLSAGSNLGFTPGGFYDNDHAYDLSVDEAFIDIPHTGETVTITWRVNDALGGQWQGGGDESWAIESVSVSVDAATPVEGTHWSGIKARY